MRVEGVRYKYILLGASSITSRLTALIAKSGLDTTRRVSS
jgi:hypothetical protein